MPAFLLANARRAWFLPRPVAARQLLSLLLLLELVQLWSRCVAQKCPSVQSGPGDFLVPLPGLPGDRSFVLHVPPTVSPDLPAPVVFVLHLGSSDWTYMRDVTEIIPAADAAGFLVVFGRGTVSSPQQPDVRTWNAGSCCGYASENNIDDAHAYFDAVLNWLEENYCIDPLRIHATGLSNGGEMAWRLACERSDRFASVAVVAGALTNSLLSACLVPCPVGDQVHSECYSLQASRSCSTPNQSPAPLLYPCTHGLRSAPVLVIGGGQDRSLPISGGIGSQMASAFPVPPLQLSIEFTAIQSGCSAPVQYWQNNTAQCFRYSVCGTGSNVSYCLIGNMGHVWPGGNYANHTYRGPATDDLRATDHILAFFKQNPVNCGLCPLGSSCQPYGVCGPPPGPSPPPPLIDIVIGAVVALLALAVLVAVVVCCARAYRTHAADADEQRRLLGAGGPVMGAMSPALTVSLPPGVSYVYGSAVVGAGGGSGVFSVAPMHSRTGTATLAASASGKSGSASGYIV